MMAGLLRPGRRLKTLEEGNRGKALKSAALKRQVSRPRDVYVFDPFGVSGQPQACFHPLDEISLDSEDIAEDPGLFAWR